MKRHWRRVGHPSNRQAGIKDASQGSVLPLPVLCYTNGIPTIGEIVECTEHTKQTFYGFWPIRQSEGWPRCVLYLISTGRMQSILLFYSRFHTIFLLHVLPAPVCTLQDGTRSGPMGGWIFGSKMKPTRKNKRSCSLKNVYNCTNPNGFMQSRLSVS